MKLGISKKYAVLMEAFRDCAIYTLDATGIIESWSAGAELIAGYTEREILGRNVALFCTPDDLENSHHLRALKRAAASGRFEQEGWRVRKDGSRFWGHSVIVALYNKRGKVNGFSTVTRDLTERKRADESVNMPDTEIQYAQKLDSLGILAGGIAHDFNNLLVSIMGHAGLALMDLEPEAPARTAVERIEMAAERAADLTKQLLAYSGKGKFVILPMNLSRLVEESSHRLCVSKPNNAQLETHLTQDLPCIEADPVQMQQVVMSLITNAWEALGDGIGSITVTTGIADLNQDDLSKTYLKENLPAGQYVCLEVSDTGCGMGEETLRRAFDPFFTTKFTGRGLGLSAVLGIVRGHRGAVQLQSDVGRGTTITVYFPVSQKQIPDVAQALGRRAGTGRASGKILVIDDEDNVRVVVRKTLEKCGLSVITAHSGREGVALFRLHANEIDAVLLDLTMPKMPGDVVLRELRRIRPDVRVIVTSGYDEQEAASRLAGEGLAGFIQKPYQPLLLIDKMCEVLKFPSPPLIPVPPTREKKKSVAR
jgi:two-component system cell cycle sensor histidine kinase/response regulator CckA